MLCALGGCSKSERAVGRVATDSIVRGWNTHLCERRGNGLARDSTAGATPLRTSKLTHYPPKLTRIRSAVRHSHPVRNRTGLDPIWWTSFQRGIRCPDRWPTREATSAPPVHGGVQSQRGAPGPRRRQDGRRRRARARSDRDGVGRVGATRAGGSDARARPG